MTIEELRRLLREARQRRDRLFAEIENLHARERSGEADEGLVERLGNLNRGLSRLDEEIRDLEAELGRAQVTLLRDRADDPERHGDGVSADRERREREREREGGPPPNPTRDAAMRAIERLALEAPAADRLVDVVERDRLGIDARYIAAVSDPAYERAFRHLVENPTDAHLRMSAVEAEAARVVASVSAERAMAVGTGSAGGWAVPILIDPTIILTSDGGRNPIRELATVTPVTSSELRLVTSEGVTASFDAEAQEASDDTPSIGQPVLIPEKAQAFVPFSIEIGQDWSTFRSEMSRLLEESKDFLEADKFTNGAGHGSNEPEGLIVGATETIVSVGSGALAADDVYAVQEALGERWQARATWLSSLPIANVVHRFFGPGSDEPPLFDSGRTRLLGKPWRENPWMDMTVVAGANAAIYGDVRAGYRIADRIGMNVELVPHLFGPNRRPTGQRGYYAYWRTTGEVVVPGAFRLLVIAT